MLGQEEKWVQERKEDESGSQLWKVQGRVVIFLNAENGQEWRSRSMKTHRIWW